MSKLLSYASSSSDNSKSLENKNIFQIIVFAAIYLFLIFTAQSWIATFNAYYQQYVIKKEKVTAQDLLILSAILSIILIVAIYFIRPTLPLFK